MKIFQLGKIRNTKRNTLLSSPQARHCGQGKDPWQTPYGKTQQYISKNYTTMVKTINFNEKP
jgi:hypothetical protein